MLSRCLNKLSAFLPKRIIQGDAHPRLGDAAPEGVDAKHQHAIEQFSLFNFRLFGIFLQRLVRDPAEQYHDDPWPGLAIRITGRYRERSLGAGLTPVERQAGRFRLLAPNRFRMVYGVEADAWVLVLRGRVQKGRAFLVGLNGDQASHVIPRPLVEADDSQAPDQLVV